MLLPATSQPKLPKLRVAGSIPVSRSNNPRPRDYTDAPAEEDSLAGSVKQAQPAREPGLALQSLCSESRTWRVSGHFATSFHAPTQLM